MFFSLFRDIPLIDLYCQLGPVQDREYENGLLEEDWQIFPGAKFISRPSLSSWKEKTLGKSPVFLTFEDFHIE